MCWWWASKPFFWLVLRFSFVSFGGLSLGLKVCPSDHALSFTWPDLSYSGLVVPRSKSSIPVMIILVLFFPLLLFNFHLVLTGFFFFVELLFVNKYAWDTDVLGFGWGHAYLLLDAVMGRVSFVGLLRSVLLLIRSGWAWIVSLSVNELACVEP